MGRLIDRPEVRSVVDHPRLAAAKANGKAVRSDVLHSTARARILPSALLVGAQRCGTTALTSALFRSPQVVRPLAGKGAHYFSLNYWRPLDWYRAQFPTVGHAALVAARGRGRLVGLDACPYYLFHPCAMERIAADLPDARLLVMLRDPVARAHSHHRHEVERGFETETDFDTALDLERDRLAGEADRMRRDPTHHSHAWEKYSYLAKGQYAEQLEEAFRLVGRDRVLVIQAESYFADQASALERVSDFIGIDRVAPSAADRRNGYDYPGLSASTLARLREHFRPHNERLYQLLGEEWDWPS